MIIHKCDNCGITVDGKRGAMNNSDPKGWYVLRYGGYGIGVRYHICADCRQSLGIPEDDGKAEAHVGDQLIELLTDIARGEVENWQP